MKVIHENHLRALTHNIANKGFKGLRRFVARFNFSCTLIGNRPQSLTGHIVNVSGQLKKHHSNMTDELSKAIEKLYQTFAIYPFKSTMDGCPCCVSASDKEKIHTKRLRELTEVDLSRYAFKAMTTWGDTDDFKHYLPRIFELLATTDFIVDTFVVLGKLDYGKWRTWSENEQTVITEFLLAWWTDSVKNKSYFDKEVFVEILKLIGNIDCLLEKWKFDFKDRSFLNYIDLVHDYYYDLITKRTGFKDIDDKSIDKLTSWIKINSDYMEKGFFYYVGQDKDIADKISTTLYIFDHNK